MCRLRFMLLSKLGVTTSSTCPAATSSIKEQVFCATVTLVFGVINISYSSCSSVVGVNHYEWCVATSNLFIVLSYTSSRYISHYEMCVATSGPVNLSV